MVEISKITYSKRRTLSVAVLPSGEVVVKAPLGLPMAEIQKFINEKNYWIENKIAKVSNNQAKFRNIIEYKELLVFGKQYYGYSSSSVSKITIQSDRILIPMKIPREKLHLKIIKWYKSIAEVNINSRLLEISKILNLSYASVKHTGSRGRWGACNNKKQLFFNWRCVMLPPDLIDYVIVHELSHLVELNHSTKFWNYVSHILPDYKERRKKLKEYGFLLKLF